MSGNILFIGTALGQGDSMLLLHAGAALLAFFCGAGFGSLLRFRHPPRKYQLSTRLLALQCLMLLIFAIGCSQFTDPDPEGIEVTLLLMLAAFSMGIQAVSVTFLGLPGVATNALTGTVTLLARGVDRLLLRKKPDEPLREGFLFLLCLSYTGSAVLVTLTLSLTFMVFVPSLLLLVVISIQEGRSVHRCSTEAAS